jgi:hypothetical protein
VFDDLTHHRPGFPHPEGRYSRPAAGPAELVSVPPMSTSRA